MPFYRIGPPGEDTWAHYMGRRAGPSPCVMPRFAEDNPNISRSGSCSRMSVALCDAPGCDRPICEMHRTKHSTKANTDFCPDHQDMRDS